MLINIMFEGSDTANCKVFFWSTGTVLAGCYSYQSNWFIYALVMSRFADV